MTPEQLQNAIESLFALQKEAQEAAIRNKAESDRRLTRIEEAQARTDVQINKMVRGIQELTARDLAKDIQDVSIKTATELIVKKFNERFDQLEERLS